MPYKIIAPKKGWSPYYRIRGTEFGQYIDRSSQTSDKREAQRLLIQWRDEAKRNSVSGPIEVSPPFSDAVISYMNANKEKRFLVPLLNYFKQKPINKITQADIDKAAMALYPEATPATRNRQVYSPMSAILRHSGISLNLRRPKGALGTPNTNYLSPVEAFALLQASDEVSPEFGALMKFLLYTGVRLSEALRLTWNKLDLWNSQATIGKTKNGKPLTVHLPPYIVAALANIERKGDSVFRLTKSGRLYLLIAEAEKRAGLELPPRSAFHVLRHTHAMWRREYTDADTSALVSTGLWASRTAAANYEHLSVTEESRKADRLPTPSRAKTG